MWWEQHWTELLALVAFVVFAIRNEQGAKQTRENLAALTEQVRRQNGRVGKLERWRAWHEGREGVTFDEEATT